MLVINLFPAIVGVANARTTTAGKDREIKSFYKALPELTTQYPLSDVINVALKETGLSQADIIYKQ